MKDNDVMLDDFLVRQSVSRSLLCGSAAVAGLQAELPRFTLTDIPMQYSAVLVVYAVIMPSRCVWLSGICDGHHG